MSKEYYLMPKELIDSRIEELNKEEKYDKNGNWIKNWNSSKEAGDFLKTHYQNISKATKILSKKVKGFYNGFQKAQELSDRRFTLKDMRKAWSSAYVDAMSLNDEDYEPLFFEDFIQSLSHTSWPVKLEMEEGKVKILKLLT